jgi:hypothetical protein
LHCSYDTVQAGLPLNSFDVASNNKLKTP